MALFRSAHTPALQCVEVGNKCEVLKNIILSKLMTQILSYTYKITIKSYLKVMKSKLYVSDYLRRGQLSILYIFIAIGF